MGSMFCLVDRRRCNLLKMTPLVSRVPGGDDKMTTGF